MNASFLCWTACVLLGVNVRQASGFDLISFPGWKVFRTFAWRNPKPGLILFIPWLGLPPDIFDVAVVVVVGGVWCGVV